MESIRRSRHVLGLCLALFAFYARAGSAPETKLSFDFTETSGRFKSDARVKFHAPIEQSLTYYVENLSMSSILAHEAIREVRTQISGAPREGLDKQGARFMTRRRDVHTTINKDIAGRALNAKASCTESLIYGSDKKSLESWTQECSPNDFASKTACRDCKTRLSCRKIDGGVECRQQSEGVSRGNPVLGDARKIALMALQNGLRIFLGTAHALHNNKNGLSNPQVSFRAANERYRATPLATHIFGLFEKDGDVTIDSSKPN